MLEKIKLLADNYLNSKGLTKPIIKIIKFNAIFISFCLIFSFLIFSHAPWFFWIFIAATLSFWNFFFLAITVQKSIYFNKINSKNTKNFIIKQIFLSNLRLFISGILLYTFLVRWNANPFALVVGLAIPLFSIPILLVIFKK